MALAGNSSRLVFKSANKGWGYESISFLISLFWAFLKREIELCKWNWSEYEWALLEQANPIAINLLS